LHSLTNLLGGSVPVHLQSLLTHRRLRWAVWALLPLLLLVFSHGAARLVGGQELPQAVQTATAAPTASPTASPTRTRPPATPTWTPLPTATPTARPSATPTAVGASPLVGFLAAQPAVPTALLGPRI